MPDLEIPDDIARSLDRLVDSLDCLEVLVFLHRGGGRSWSAAEVADDVGISARAARRGLDRWVGAGAAAPDAGDGFRSRRPTTTEPKTCGAWSLPTARGASG